MAETGVKPPYTLNELFPRAGRRVATMAIWDYTPEMEERMRAWNVPQNCKTRMVRALYHGKQVIMWVICPDDETRMRDEQEIMEIRRRR